MYNLCVFYPTVLFAEDRLFGLVRQFIITVTFFQESGIQVSTTVSLIIAQSPIVKFYLSI